MKLSVQPGYGTNPERLKPAVDLSDTPLKDGTYKVTFASVEIETGGDDIWTPVMQSYGNSNYVVLKKEGDKYTVDNIPAEMLQLHCAYVLIYSFTSGVSLRFENSPELKLDRGRIVVYPHRLSLSLKIETHNISVMTRIYCTTSGCIIPHPNGNR